MVNRKFGTNSKRSKLHLGKDCRSDTQVAVTILPALLIASACGRLMNIESASLSPQQGRGFGSLVHTRPSSNSLHDYGSAATYRIPSGLSLSVRVRPGNGDARAKQ